MPSERKKLSRVDLALLKNRLTAEHLVSRTMIFQADWDKKEVGLIAQKFKEYWNSWIKDDLERLFEEMESRKM